MRSTDYAKELAAKKSLDFIEDGMVVGLGTGSTATRFIKLLGERVKRGLKIRAIPSSNTSKELAESLSIPIIDFQQCPEIDVAIDGADEIAPGLALIKGGGGALLHEKIVASASRRFIVIADSSKVVTRLGKVPLPVEVIPTASPLVTRKLVRWESVNNQTVKHWLRVHHRRRKFDSRLRLRRNPGCRYSGRIHSEYCRGCRARSFSAHGRAGFGFGWRRREDAIQMTFRYGRSCGLQLTLAVGSMDCQDLRQEAMDAARRSASCSLTLSRDKTRLNSCRW